MSPTTVRPRSEPKTWSAPGKVFLLGEYAVLSGAPAWVCTVPPRFELRLGTGLPPSEVFHAESPAGRLVRYFEKRGQQPGCAARSGQPAPDSAPLLEFHDPREGRGGLGASTAQFALVFQAYLDASGILRSKEVPPWKLLWGLYRELTGHEPVPPSGADLVAQWQGGLVRFSPGTMTLEPLLGDAPESLLEFQQDPRAFMIFSTTRQKNRKVATHEHLASLGGPDAAFLQSPVLGGLKRELRKAAEAARTGDSRLFADALNSYGDTLAAAGLEIAATREDRIALGALPGVLAVKGTGALQADGLVVMLDSDRNVDEVRRRIREIAERRDLELIAETLSGQAGVTCPP